MCHVNLVWWRTLSLNSPHGMLLLLFQSSQLLHYQPVYCHVVFNINSAVQMPGMSCFVPCTCGNTVHKDCSVAFTIPKYRNSRAVLVPHIIRVNDVNSMETRDRLSGRRGCFVPPCLQTADLLLRYKCYVTSFQWHCLMWMLFVLLCFYGHL